MSLEIDIRLKRNEFELCFQAECSAGITGLFGPSGSGKTTLLHCIAGLTKPDAGRIVLDGDILYETHSHHLPAWKRQIGLVFQDHLLFPHLSVTRNMTYGLQGPRKERKQRLCEIAELLEIDELLKRKVTHLSGGQKQRVALARAILTSPRLLLLDEPFTGLDQALKRQLIPYLRRLYERTRIPMILVSHSPEDIAGMTDEILFIENGRFFAQGKLAIEPISQPTARLCHSDTSHDFAKMRNHLIKNHGMQFQSTQKLNVI